MEMIINWFLSPRPYVCLAVIVISLVIWIASRRFVRKVIGKTNKKDAFAEIILNIIKYLLIACCILVILQVNGVDVTSAIAGLGIASVIVGLALQDALKDIIMGVNIISENFFRVGDVVKIGEYAGRVTNLSLKSTRITNGEDGYEVRICNRNIDKVFVYTDILNLDIPLSYGEKREKLEPLFKQLAAEFATWNEVKKASFLGLQDYQDSSILYRMRINVAPQNRLNVRRKALQRIDEVLRENGISIPFPQLDVHYESKE
ncbi:MAG: mechanosensitive ion channel family protein [Clostridiales bacterium]|nr:mechanosensitive ion channel family protein [Clostridiales bacterium]